MEISEGPQFVERALRHTLGIRASVPYRGEPWATDPRTEPRKKQRYVQLDFLVRSVSTTQEAT